MTATDSAPSAARGERRFPDPYEIPTPEGAEGWRELYAYHNLFHEVRRDIDGRRTWFRNGMHFPEPMPPFDIVTSDQAFMSTGVMNTRVFALPPALGIDVRVVNGYVYMSANGVTDAEQINRRAQEFAVRVGHYYQNWDDLYARWEDKMRAHIQALKDVTIPALGEFEPREHVLAGRGLTEAHDLLVAYHRLLESVDGAWNLHSELLNMGYAAYLNFLQTCKAAFPEIADQTVAKMVSGVDVTVFEPDDRLKELAADAIELGVADTIIAHGEPDELRAALESSAPGRSWLASFDNATDPWFHFSYGNGFYHHHGSWVDDLSFPIRMIAEYIERRRRGENLERPLDQVRAERDETVRRYRELITDDETRKAFDEGLGLSRTVYPYVENHNFFVEHWYMTVFWHRMREIGALLADRGFFARPDDVFFLRRAEVHEAIVDLQFSWSSGGDPQGPTYWPPIVTRRREIMDVLRSWTPPPALGPAPDEIVEPMTIMLWGITDDQVRKWLDAQEADEAAGRVLSGFAGSPGVVEGTARVVMKAEDLGTLEEGEILVAPTTSTSWTPVFQRISAAVSDIGGIMCHAAIVSREYGLPAVVGTGLATATIATGDRLRVDGNQGTVTILAGA